MFIATANDLSAIPAPLRDRMEVIQISGYTLEEKIEIARKYLVPKSIKNCGLETKGFVLDDLTISMIISQYTREAGVRDLERYIQKLCSKYARALVENKVAIVRFDTLNMHEYLGPAKIMLDQITHNHKIGVTNGLAWTAFGGDILQVEAVLMPGTGKLILTGTLGDVIKEYAQAAMTYAKANAAVFGIEAKTFNEFDLHIHLPAGAIPKDGPSAGITLLSSILSAYTKRAINGEFAMTGELNLRGEVLPIGGVKEKILAAKQHGLKNVIIPKQNEKDLIGLDKISEGVRILLVENVSEVLEHVLLPV
jgi:ATP-dependent Lon protease